MVIPRRPTPGSLRVQRDRRLRAAPKVGMARWRKASSASRPWIPVLHAGSPLVYRPLGIGAIQVLPDGRDDFERLNSRDPLHGMRVELPNGHLFATYAYRGDLRVRRAARWLRPNIYLHGTADWLPWPWCPITGAKLHWFGSHEFQQFHPRWLTEPRPQTATVRSGCLAALGKIDGCDPGLGTNAGHESSDRCPDHVADSLRSQLGALAKRFGEGLSSQAAEDMEGCALAKVRLAPPPEGEADWNWNDERRTTPYLLRVARNAMTDRLRWEMLRIDFHGELLDPDWAYIDVTAADPLATILAREALLASDWPEVSILHEYGYRLHEVAELLRRSHETVKKQAQRSREQFYAYLSDNIEPWSRFPPTRRGGGPLDD